MSTKEHIILSQLRIILGQVNHFFASIQQQGSVEHQSAFRIELVKHLDDAERQQVPVKQLILFCKTLRCMEGVGDLLAEVTLGLIFKLSDEGLFKLAGEGLFKLADEGFSTTQVRYPTADIALFVIILSCNVD